MTHPAAVIAGVVSVVAIVAVIGAMRLSPDAGTDKLVDNGSAAFEGTQQFRDRFGDDAIVVLAEGDLKKLMLTSDVDRLLALETCLAGRTDASESAVSITPAGAIATIARTRSSLSEGVAAGEGGVEAAGRPMLQKIGSTEASAWQCVRIRDRSGMAPASASTV